ncbi:MAG: DNA-binding transcriptional LysR family regulator [Alteromonadaceae bacterium]
MTKKTNLDFELLRTFIAVVDNGTLTRAANQIHRSQSAISMQIKRLESQLGQGLFLRSGRGLQLTHEGKSLVSYARRLLNLHDQALSDLTASDDTQQLRIGCPDDYSVQLIPVLLLLLRQKNPKLRVSITTDNSSRLRQAMDNNEIDIAIMTRLAGSNEGELIYVNQGVWVANNENCFKQEPLPLVLFEPSCKFNSSVIDALEKSEIPYDLICEASHISLLTALVERGFGISVMPLYSVPDKLMIIENLNLPELPVAEVCLCLSGGKQFIAGWSLNELAKQLALKDI